jgi:hypothetical protein
MFVRLLRQLLKRGTDADETADDDPLFVTREPLPAGPRVTAGTIDGAPVLVPLDREADRPAYFHTPHQPGISQPVEPSILDRDEERMLPVPAPAQRPFLFTLVSPGPSRPAAAPRGPIRAPIPRPPAAETPKVRPPTVEQFRNTFLAGAA